MTDPSTARYTHLGPFSGLVAAAKAVRPLFGQPPIAGPESRQRAKESLRFHHRRRAASGHPKRPRVDGGRSPRGRDLVVGRIRPADRGIRPQTPGERRAIAGRRRPARSRSLQVLRQGEDRRRSRRLPRAARAGFRQTYYGGRAYANCLARAGFVVLAHDTFLWGSRKFPLEIMPDRERALAEAVGATLEQEYAGPEIVRYNGAALPARAPGLQVLHCVGNQPGGGDRP